MPLAPHRTIQLPTVLLLAGASAARAPLTHPVGDGVDARTDWRRSA